ncbi:MAG: hypothetical protein FWB99_00125 [Treponema sp.]|nr:hypothetical protein [Treponema sp.]
MDERKSIIRELEDKKRADTEARSRLLEGLGETLIQKMEEGGSFSESAGGILAEYRARRNEIAAAADTIKSLEAESLRLKEMEDSISAKEGETSRLTKDFAEACTTLGKALLAVQFSDDFAAAYRQQEDTLLSKIEDQEQKARELEEREGGVLAWLGKNAQMAVSKALVLKNRSALQRVYRSAGEQFFVTKPSDTLEGEAATAAGNAEDIKRRLDSLADDLVILKGERKKITDTFGAEGSPSRRISALQKRMAVVKDEFPGLYLKLGSLATKSEGKEALVSVLNEENRAVLERAAFHQTSIEEREQKIKKVKASISIDNEKAEIEKIKKAIANQRHKIAAANEEISVLEKQIDEAEQNIEGLKAVLEESE